MSSRRDVVFLIAERQVCERHACRLPGLDRSTYRYEPRSDRSRDLRDALVALARQKPRYRYRRLWVLLTRRGWTCSENRSYASGIVIVGNQESMFIEAAPYREALTRSGYSLARTIGDASIWLAPR